jgi:hypothetical protein
MGPGLAALIDDPFAEAHGQGCGGAGHDAAVRMAVGAHGRVAGALTVAGQSVVITGSAGN